MSWRGWERSGRGWTNEFVLVVDVLVSIEVDAWVLMESYVIAECERE